MKKYLLAKQTEKQATENAIMFTDVDPSLDKDYIWVNESEESFKVHHFRNVSSTDRDLVDEDKVFESTLVSVSNDDIYFGYGNKFVRVNDQSTVSFNFIGYRTEKILIYLKQESVSAQIVFPQNEVKAEKIITQNVLEAGKIILLSVQYYASLSTYFVKKLALRNSNL